MDCQRCTTYLNSYVDGTLGARRSTTVREHIASCPRCQREYDELLRLHILLRHLPAPTSREDFWTRAHATVRRQTLAQPTGKRALSLPARFAAAVAPRAALASTALVALILAAVLTLPGILTPASHSLHSSPYTSPLSVQTRGPITSVASNPVVSADALVALHAVHDFSLPLADKGSMGYTVSEADQVDLKDDDALDIR